MEMKYHLFLFDLDDTLLDFRASERLSFVRALRSMGVSHEIEELFKYYQVENAALWKLFEENKTTKEHLKVERFRKVFNHFGIEMNPELASNRYLEALPETVVLMDQAVELCAWLKDFGEIGVITNGIQSVQSQRIQNSGIAPFISFVSVSDECGFPKPDVRFFEFTVKKAKQFDKSSTIIIGDREEADILGAHNFGIDSCWFNPHQKVSSVKVHPTFEIAHLSELRAHLLGKL